MSGPADEVHEAVVRGGAASYAQQITAGGHTLIADEPVALGGTDEGPSPYQLLISALGACTSITITMYARRKEWPLEAVTVKLRHTKVRPPEGASSARLVDRIERDVELHGPLSDEQRARLLDIANKCPVHRTLQSEIDIRTQLV